MPFPFFDRWFSDNGRQPYFVAQPSQTPVIVQLTIMIGTQRIAAQWLWWAAVAYISYRLMLIAETGDSDMLFIAIHFLVLWAIIQRPQDLDALADAAGSFWLITCGSREAPGFAFTTSPKESGSFATFTAIRRAWSGGPLPFFTTKAAPVSSVDRERKPNVNELTVWLIVRRAQVAQARFPMNMRQRDGDARGYAQPVTEREPGRHQADGVRLCRGKMGHAGW
jgi:hypothetical protein